MLHKVCMYTIDQDILLLLWTPLDQDQIAMIDNDVHVAYMELKVQWSFQIQT